MTIGENIRKYRKIKGLSQEELGSKIGRAARTIRGYEMEVNSPSMSVIKDIAKALNIDVLNIIGDEVKEMQEALDHFVNATTENALKIAYNTAPGWTKIGFDEKFKNPHEFWSDVVFSYPSKFYDLSSLGLNEDEFDEAIEEISTILEIAYNLKVKEIFNRRNQKK
ncbi:helix-turn-helix transcriptional regulator [Clostridium botulinum]|nr:helix-turn-helix transcriptional regulator [Clostridium botulinum]